MKRKHLKTGAFTMWYSSVWGKDCPPLQPADSTMVTLDRLHFRRFENGFKRIFKLMFPWDLLSSSTSGIFCLHFYLQCGATGFSTRHKALDAMQVVSLARC
jgi:hypothetical protein